MALISDIYANEYLKCVDLKGADVPLTIDRVELREFENDQQKPVLHFKETDKKLVCNKTNAGTIASFAGNNTDDWPGNVIVLHPTKTDFQGRYVDAIRVHQPKPETTTPQPHEGTEELNDEIPF